MSRGTGSTQQRSGPWAGRAPLLIAGALLCVGWALVLMQTEHSIFGRVPILDEVWYLDRAAEVAGHADPVADEPHFMSPLYPVLVAAAGAGGGVPEDGVFDGGELRGLRLLQIACWLGTLVLIRVLAGRLVPPDWTGWRRTVATWLPALLYALYRPAAVYAMAVLLETPLVLLLVLTAVLLTGPGLAARRPRVLLALGVVIGLAGLLRGTALLLLPVAWVAVVLRGDGQRPRAVVAGLVVTAGTLLVLAPPIWHNSRLAGHPVGPTLNGGVNLYIGNGPAANGFYVAAVPGDWRRDPAGRAFLAGRFGRDDVSLAAADRLWRDEAWRHMRADPVRVAGLVLRKVWLQLQGWEIDQLTPLAGWTATVPALRAWVVPYALLMVLGAAGFAAGVGRGGSPQLRWLLVVLVVLLGGQSLFFVVSRYRLALVPFWCVAAGWGTVHLAGRQMRGRRAALVAAVVAGLLAVPWGLNEVRADWAGLAAANEALRWADLGRAEGDDAALARAADLYREALAVEPDRAASWLGLATVLAARGDTVGQVAALRAGADQTADPLPVLRVLLGTELAQGDPGGARRTAERILLRAPADPNALHNLTVILAGAGDLEGALARARQLRNGHPDDPQGYIDTGVVLARLGRRNEAREAFAAGVARFPEHADLRRNLARVAP